MYLCIYIDVYTLASLRLHRQRESELQHLSYVLTPDLCSNARHYPPRAVSLAQLSTALSAREIVLFTSLSLRLQLELKLQDLSYVLTPDLCSNARHPSPPCAVSLAQLSNALSAREIVLFTSLSLRLQLELKLQHLSYVLTPDLCSNVCPPLPLPPAQCRSPS